jgi:hypothetical protein
MLYGIRGAKFSKILRNFQKTAERWARARCLIDCEVSQSIALLASFGRRTQPTQWQRIGNQIDAAMIFAWPDFINVPRA